MQLVDTAAPGGGAGQRSTSTDAVTGAAQRAISTGRLVKALINSPLYPAALVIAAVCFWQFVIARGVIGGLPTRYIGSPSGVWSSFVSLTRNGYQGSSLWVETYSSLVRVLLGFGIGAAVAIPLGTLMGLYAIAPQDLRGRGE